MLSCFPHSARLGMLLLALGALSCTSSPPDARSTVRLNPIVTSDPRGLHASILTDRDTTRFVTLDAPVTLTLTFPHAVDVRALKVFGGEHLNVALGDMKPRPVSAQGRWETESLSSPLHGDQFTLHLVPTGLGARLSEVELWGAGAPSAPRDPKLLAHAFRLSAQLPYENAAAFHAAPTSFTLHPVGDGSGESCARARLTAAVPMRAVRRAYLSYEANGVPRPVVLARSLNGRAPQGGFWLGGGNVVRPVIDELDPEALTGQDEVTLCLPPEATEPVNVSGLRLLVELDDGTHTLDRDARLRLAEAYDGLAGTAASFPSERLELRLERPTAITRAELLLDMPSARVAAGAFDGASWVHLGELELNEGWNEFPTSGQIAAALALDFRGVARPDVPAASVAELQVTGSGVGPRVAFPRIVITSPTLRRTSEGDVGERFGDRAYLAGWAESPQGPATLEVDGAPVGTGDGAFGVALRRPAGAAGPWSVTLRATFPDGLVLSRVIRLEDDRTEELLRDGVLASGGDVGADARFGREGQTAWGTAEPGKDNLIQLGASVSLEVPAGAVSRSTPVGITHKAPEAVPPLDPGMVNVTAPENAAYRFSPPGQKFARPARIRLPFDARLLPEGISAEQIQTFFFDDVAKQWKPLPRVQVARGTSQVVSETTHFTFMVNAVLVTPEHPGPLSFDPNALKGLKAADPSEGLDLIEPPQGDSQGTARLTYPIRLPRGRGAYQPEVRLAYDSNGSNGWLGVGWSVSVSSVAVDTRHGVPSYGGDEVYLLDGQMLVPVTPPGGEPCMSGRGRRYVERVAQVFHLIRRCGTDPSNYHWEVTDKNGTVHVYGKSATSRLQSYLPPHPIAEWMLEKVVDTNGNVTTLDYFIDGRQIPASGGRFTSGSGEDWRYVYPKSIQYTANTVTGAAPAYRVRFLLSGGDEPVERPDVVTSGRTGFKTAVRFRLQAIRVELDVGPDRGVIREYALAYDQEHMTEGSAYGRSLLTAIRVKGAGPNGSTSAGPDFYEHKLDYFRSTPNDRSFSAPVPWALGPSGQAKDKDALTDSSEHSFRSATYLGLAPPVLAVKSLSSGWSFGSSSGERRTRSFLVDLNGDGLPDRIRGNQVLFNQAAPVPLVGGASQSRTFSSLAPAGDPGAGMTVSFNSGQVIDLAQESIQGTDSAYETYFAIGQGSVGDTTTRTDAVRILTDADGDGRIDLVSGNEVLFSQPRQRTCPANSPECCPTGDICLKSGMLGAVSESGEALRNDPRLLQLQARDRERAYPTDALIRWEAPYTGRVDLTGTFQKLRTDPEDDADGVTLQAFLQLPGQAPTLLGAWSSGPTDVGVKSLQRNALDVLAGDVVFFMLSTGADFPFGKSGSAVVGLDEVALEPVLSYSHFCLGRGTTCQPVDAGALSATDPSGHPLTKFVLKNDLRVAGGPLMGVSIPVHAQIILGGMFTKQRTADDITVCIQEHATQTGHQERPCAAGDLLVRRYAWDQQTSEPLMLSRRVAPGKYFVFRVESDTPTDPRQVSWLPEVRFTELCSPDGNCRPVLSEEEASLRSRAEPFIAFHAARFQTSPAIYVVPRGGRVKISTKLSSANDSLPVHAVIHRGTERVFKLQGAHSTSVELDVTQGEQLFFHAHGEGDTPPQWNVTLEFTSTSSDGGTAATTYQVGALNISSEGTRHAFGGGYRGFSFGEWNGKEAFDPRLIGALDSAQWEGLSEEELQSRIKERLSDPNSPESRVLRLFTPLVPRQRGVRLSSASGSGPVWASLDGNTFVAPGRAHAARKQGLVQAGSNATSPLALDLSGVVRSSVNESSGGSLGLSIDMFGLGLSATKGPTDTLMESLDLNGDGLLDAISNGEARLTRPLDLGKGAVFPFSAPIRRSEGFTLQLSPSVSMPRSEGSSKGTANKATALNVVGAVLGLLGGQHSLGVSRQEVVADLVDVNGDGLVDRVERGAESNKLKVYLNLGTRFAAQADELLVAPWSTPVDQFLLGEQEAAVRRSLKSLIDVEWPAPVSSATLQQNTAMTLSSSWGAGFGIGSGANAGAAFQSSLARVSVDMLDVNGDGLPDLVKKGALDSSFKVQVNLGYGFAPEEDWTVPGWGSIPRPKFRGYVGALRSVLNGLGVNASGEVDDGLSLTATYSDPLSWSASAGIPVNISFLCPFCPALIIEETLSENRARTGFELAMEDLDGDGYADHVLKNEEQPETIWARMNNLGAARTGLLRSVQRPLGGRFELDYARLGNTVDMPQSRWVLARTVTRDGRGAPSPGLAAGHELETRYEYSGGFYDRDEREFRGFARVIRRHGNGTTGGDGSTITQDYANTDAYRQGLLLRETTADKDGRLFIELENEYQVTAHADGGSGCRTTLPHPLVRTGLACEARFPELRKTLRRLYEGSGVFKETSQRYQYDAFGNVTYFEDLGDGGSEDDVLAVLTYPPAPAQQAPYIVSTPLTLTVKDRGGTVLQAREGRYDARGNLQTLLSALGDGRWATTEMAWTNSGNLWRFTSPANERGERYTVEYTHDTETDSLVTGTTDSFRLTSSATYDARFGVAVRTVDATGNITERRVDAFGRLTDVFAPTDLGSSRATIHFQYAPEARPARAITEHKMPAGSVRATLDTIVFIDGLKRSVQTKKTAEVAGRGIGMTVSGQLTFDVMGRVFEEGQPFFSAGPRETFIEGAPLHPTRSVYDVMGRKVRVEEPDGTTTSLAYGIEAPPGSAAPRLVATVTDGMSNIRKLYRDMANRVVAVEERIDGRRPTTRYSYDPLGQLTRLLDAAGNVTSMEYDLLGRRTRLHSPDAGQVDFAYDDAGNLIRKVDGNLRATGRAIRYGYHFNRLDLIDYPFSTDVRYVYGEPGTSADNAAGRIQEVTDEAGTERRAYGKLGELVETTRTVRPLRPGDKPRTFTTKFELDAFGRVLALRYPDGEVVRYTYDAGGLVASAEGARPASQQRPAEKETYLRRMRYDEFGQRTELVLGNGATTTYTYDPLTRRLSQLSTHVPGGRGIQALTYAYDRVGNITGVTNALGAPVGKRAGAVSYTYGYDALYRLTSATGSALSRPGVEDRFSSRFEYSDIHNLTRKVQSREIVSTLSGGASTERPAQSNHDDVYLYDGASPHQATRIGDTLLAYDANGNTVAECRSPQGLPCDTTGPRPDTDVSRTHLRRYSWTEENRLSAVIDGGGQNATRFLYDAAGNRVAKLGRGGTSLTVGQFFSLRGRQHGTKHIFAGQERLASKLLPMSGSELGGGQEPSPGSPDNVRGCEPSDYQPQKCPEPVVEPPLEHLSVQQVKPATYYYHPDHLGSTSWVTDASGRVHERVEYFPYGEVWREGRTDTDGGPAPTSSFLFTGKEFDEETGLTFFGARYYDARKARWLSADPLLAMEVFPEKDQRLKSPAPVRLVVGEVQVHGRRASLELSLYAYAANNPVRYVDPTGLKELSPAEAKQVIDAIDKIAQVPGYATAASDLKSLHAAGKIEAAGAMQKGLAVFARSDPNAVTTAGGIIYIYEFTPTLGLDETLVHEHSHWSDLQTGGVTLMNADPDVDGPTSKAWKAGDDYNMARAWHRTKQTVAAQNAKQKQEEQSKK